MALGAIGAGEGLGVEKLQEIAQALGTNFVLHRVLPVDGGVAEFDQSISRFLATRNRNHRVLDAMTDKDRQRRLFWAGGKPTGEFGRKPTRKGHQRGIA